MPVLAQADSCMRGDSLDTLSGEETEESIASKIFPQRFSRRKSLCFSYICACCTSPFSQFARNKCSPGSPLTTTKRCLTHVQPMQRQGNKSMLEDSPLEADHLSKRSSHEERLAIEQPPKNCLAK